MAALPAALLAGDRAAGEPASARARDHHYRLAFPGQAAERERESAEFVPKGQSRAVDVGASTLLDRTRSTSLAPRAETAAFRAGACDRADRG